MIGCMDLFLVRHGETQENADGINQGWLDTELNETGRLQAETAAKAFNEDIDAIFSSDLKRSVQTAEKFRQKYPDTPYFEDGRLRERNFGDAQGKRKDRQDWEVFWASNNTISIPNAETLNEFTKRVKEFIESIRELPYQRILIVTHGGTINRISHIINENHEFQDYGNASVTHLYVE